MAANAIQPSDSATFRKEVAERAKDFKASWIQMGRYIYAVYTDKLFRSWGFREFETYCAKEIGIKPQTAVKLLRSYYFLEKEEPAYVKTERFRGEDAPRVPDYEAVNLLRLAKNRKLDEEDYSELRKQVLEEGTPLQTVKREYRKVLEAQKSDSPEDLEVQRQKSVIRRTLSTLKSLQRELAAGNLVTKKKIVQLDSFIKDLEEELKIAVS